MNKTIFELIAIAINFKSDIFFFLMLCKNI